MKIKPCLYFNKKSLIWENYNPESISDKINVTKMEKNIKISTFNVLKPSKSMVNYIKFNKERYNYQISTLLPNTDPNILCLNEIINPHYLNKIKNKESYFSKNNFYISSIPKSEKTGNIIISKYPFYYIYIKGNAHHLKFGTTIGLFFNNNLKKNFLVISTQLRPLEDNDFLRKEELQIIIDNINRIKTTNFYKRGKKNNYSKEKNIIDKENKQNNILDKKQNNFLDKEKKIRERFKKAIEANNIVITGTLNFHKIYETNFIYQKWFDFLDIWLEKKKIDKGYTWNTKENFFLNFLQPYDNRKMRLDSILLKNKSNIFKEIKNVEIFGKDILPGKFILRASDHFGIISEFVFNDKNSEEIYKQNFFFNFNGYNIESKDLYFTGKGNRSFLLIRFYRALTFISFVLLFIYCMISFLFN